VTLTAPDGANTAFTIPAEDAANFQGSLFAYYGVRPTDTSRIGQSATFSRIRITGAASAIDENFVSQGPPYALDSNKWIKRAVHGPGVFVTPPDAKYWLSWPMPDSGFTNVFATDDLSRSLAASQWKSLPASTTGWIPVGGNKRLAVISESVLSSSFGYQPANCYFGLWQVTP
jgi:hypothetical protein